jgi:hypothetical protein
LHVRIIHRFEWRKRFAQGLPPFTLSRSRVHRHARMISAKRPSYLDSDCRKTEAIARSGLPNRSCLLMKHKPRVLRCARAMAEAVFENGKRKSALDIEASLAVVQAISSERGKNLTWRGKWFKPAALRDYCRRAGLTEVGISQNSFQGGTRRS